MAAARVGVALCLCFAGVGWAVAKPALPKRPGTCLEYHLEYHLFACWPDVRTGTRAGSTLTLCHTPSQHTHPRTPLRRAAQAAIRSSLACAAHK